MDQETERRLANLEGRFQKFDLFQRSVELNEREREARADERAKSMEKWMESIDSTLDDRKSNERWMLRIVGTAILAAILNFILRGGLAGVAG